MPTQQTFDTPGNSTFTVPANVTAIRVEVWGAQGGDATVDASGSGGLGGKAEGIISVTPGEDLDINVGAAGADSSSSNTADGGEASDVRQGGTTLSDRVLVAGGGGAAADGTRTSDGTNGGAGGASTGQDGDGSGNPVGASDDNIPGGTGGTQTSGGLSGGPSSNDGTFGFGGAGDTQDATPGGGGGGDGWWGGGGGGQRLDDSFSDDYASAGGGGSNHITASASDTVSTRGVQSGDGQVRLTFAETPNVSIDSLTETGETDVRIQASNANTYESSGEWQVRRDGDSILTDFNDADLDYTDSDATGGVSNSYEVTRVNDYGSDAATQSIKVRLETVSGLIVTGTTATEVSLAWDPVENAGSYEVLRATSAGADYSDYTQVGTASSGTSFTDTGLTEGVEYHYTIRAEAQADPAFDSRYPGEVTATTGFSAPTLENVSPDSETKLAMSFQREDNNDSGDIVVVVDGTDVATLNYDATSYVVTGLSAATRYGVQVRRETSTATATSSTLYQYTAPPEPPRPTVQTDQTAQTHTLVFGALPTEADGIEVFETRDAPASALRDAQAFDHAGVQLTEVSPSATSYETDRQDRLSTYTYYVRAYVGEDDERAENVSDSTTQGFSTYDNYWFALERTDGTAFTRRRTVESGPTYEHSALHHYTHATPQSDLDAGADAFADVDVYLDDARLFRGTFRTFEGDTPAEGATTGTAFGPALPLRRDGPATPVTYQNEARADAIRDYWSRISTVDVDAVVHDPPTETIEADTVVISDSLSGFAGLASPAADEPYDTSGGSLALQQAAFVSVTSDFSGNITTGDDFSDGTAPWHIDSEYATLTSGSVYDDITPTHDIPADRVGVAIHGDPVDTAVGTVSQYPFTFNGTEIDTLPFLSTDRWSIYPDAYGNSGGGDLSAGTSYRLELALNGSDAEYNIDALVLYDTAYGPFTFDDPTSLGEKIDGPKLHKPVPVDLVDEPRPYPISTVRVDSTVTDTSNAFEWDISTTGGASSLTADTADATLDFAAADQYGTGLAPSVTLDGYGSNSWLADGATGQEITSLDISVTTETIPVISDVELTGSHFENLQTLHQDSDFRWVVDPTVARVDGLVVDSFVPSDPAVVREPTWTQTDVQPSRDTLGYANAVTILYTDADGDAQQFVAPANQSEVDRNGEEIRARVPREDVETNDEARIAAVNELRKRIAEDTQSGRIEAVATPGVLPGFPYDVDAFGGPTALDDSVSYRASAGQNTMTLRFLRELSPFERQLAAESAIQSLRGP